MFKRVREALVVLFFGGSVELDAVRAKMQAQDSLQASKEALENVRRVVAELRGVTQQTAVFNEFQKQNEGMNRLAVFVRENYHKEIERGDHNSFGSVVDAAIHYMRKERNHAGENKG